LHTFERVRRDHARLVEHDVLAVAHGLDCDAGAVARDRGAADDVDRRIAHQRIAVLGRRKVGKALAHASEHARVTGLRPVARAGQPGLEQAFNQMIDVAMVETDHGKTHGQPGLRLFRLRYFVFCVPTS
jgi:hypothetical protein